VAGSSTAYDGLSRTQWWNSTVPAGVLAATVGPLGTGADLIGTAGRAINYTVISTTGIALVQLGCVVVGHLIAA
jgi:hypothetical protein